MQRGVVEVARRPPFPSRDQRLIDTTVEPDEMSAGAERQPIQLDGGRDATVYFAGFLCVRVHAITVERRS